MVDTIFKTHKSNSKIPYFFSELLLHLTSFQTPLLSLNTAQSSVQPPLLLGSLLFHFLEPSAHVALLGRQSHDGSLQRVSVNPLSPDVVPLSHTHVLALAMSLAPIHKVALC